MGGPGPLSTRAPPVPVEAVEARPLQARPCPAPGSIASVASDGPSRAGPVSCFLSLPPPPRLARPPARGAGGPPESLTRREGGFGPDLTPPSYKRRCTAGASLREWRRPAPPPSPLERRGWTSPDAPDPSTRPPVARRIPRSTLGTLLRETSCSHLPRGFLPTSPLV